MNNDYYKIPSEKLTLNEPKLTANKVVKKHNIIIDSRQRNYDLYPTPSEYMIDLYEPHRNVEKIELTAVVLPKTEYNVNSENNLLIVTIGGITNPLYLNIGQYYIGSNTQGKLDYSTNDNNNIFGLTAELERTLNTHSVVVDSGLKFKVLLVTAPGPEDPLTPSRGTGRYASVLNRIVIINENEFSIDFRNIDYQSDSPYRLLGFDKLLITSNRNNYIYGNNIDPYSCTNYDLQQGEPLLITSNSILSNYDYSIIEDPKFIIMELEFGNNSAERVESNYKNTNQKFAVIIYDANEPDNIYTYNTQTDVSGNVKLGIVKPPGRLKALKGSDFDKKIIEFPLPILIENFKIIFTKYDGKPYNFNNREHLLIFELSVVEFDPKYRT
jgi:hypothetical protein